MDDVQLERRLTLIEAAQSAAATAANANHSSAMVAIGKVEGKVDVQNSKVAKLETWRTQVTAIYGAILAAAPFVFFALNKLFGM